MSSKADTCAGGGCRGGGQLWARRLQQSSKVHLGALRGAQQVEAGQGGHLLLLLRPGHDGMPAAQLVGQDTADASGTVLTPTALDQTHGGCTFRARAHFVRVHTNAQCRALMYRTVDVQQSPKQLSEQSSKAINCLSTAYT